MFTNLRWNLDLLQWSNPVRNGHLRILTSRSINLKTHNVISKSHASYVHVVEKWGKRPPFPNQPIDYQNFNHTWYHRKGGFKWPDPLLSSGFWFLTPLLKIGKHLLLIAQVIYQVTHWITDVYQKFTATIFHLKPTHPNPGLRSHLLLKKSQQTPFKAHAF